MSTFAVQILPVVITAHPQADKLDLAIVGATAETGFRCVVLKNQFQTGDLVAYLPEASLVPPALLEQMGLTGRLAGPDGNRVKAIKLRGEISQGLVWVPSYGWETFGLINGITIEPGIDIASILGVTKYTPAIPANMAGKMVGDAPSYAQAVDMDNIKRYGDMFTPGEFVWITEKIHGSQCNVLYDGSEVKITSKGILTRNKATLLDDPTNLYWQVFHSSNMMYALKDLYAILGVPFQVAGEVYGAVQDLRYGLDKERRFVAFDLRYEEDAGRGAYMSSSTFFDLMDRVGIPTVPLLFFGPYHYDVVKKLTDGPTVLGHEAHIREGIVIKGDNEDPHPKYGRRILKSVSTAYLTRSGNTTELE